MKRNCLSRGTPAMERVLDGSCSLSCPFPTPRNSLLKVSARRVPIRVCLKSWKQTILTTYRIFSKSFSGFWTRLLKIQRDTFRLVFKSNIKVRKQGNLLAKCQQKVHHWRLGLEMIITSILYREPHIFVGHIFQLWSLPNHVLKSTEPPNQVLKFWYPKKKVLIRFKM